MLFHCNCTGYERYDEILAFSGDIVFGYTLIDITTHEYYYVIKYYLLFLNSTVVFTPNPQLLIQIAKLQN